MNTGWARKVVLGLGLLAPAAIVYAAFLMAPLADLVGQSFEPGRRSSVPTNSFSNYLRFLTDSYYIGIMWQTVRIAAIASIAAVVLAYPIAIFLYLSRSWFTRVALVLVMSPLFVSVAVRSYGWILILGNDGPLGALNLLFTQAAVVIGLVHLLLPFAVVSLTTSLAAVDPVLVAAARTLGSGPRRVITTVLLPLSLPGVLSAIIIGFSLAMTAFATPMLLGGSRARTMVAEIYEQELVVFDWPYAAAMSVLLLLISTAAILIATRLLRQRMPALVAG